MTSREIVFAAYLAGFVRISLDDSIRINFARGPNFLNIQTDGTWVFYKKIPAEKPDRYGADFESLC